MDVAEVYRRALEHRLQEAFTKPGDGVPHNIEIPSTDSLWDHFVAAVRALAQPVDSDGTCFKGELNFGEATTRLIFFHLQHERRVLIATCLAGW